MRNGWLAQCGALLLICWVGLLSARADEAFTARRLSFASHGKTIRVDEFAPTSPGPHPTAVVLHGAGGMFFDAPEMHRLARDFAANGIRAEVIHYFDGSGVPFTRSDRVLHEHFDEWLGVVRDAVAFAQGREEAPGNRPVAVYGYSMGAFLGIAASSDNPRVGALAEQAGGVWDNQMNRVGRMPPVLMIHGRADQRVVFQKYVPPLEATLRQRGAQHETLFIDGEGHGFTPAAQARARQAATTFIRRQLDMRKADNRDKKPGRFAGAGTNQ